MIASATAPTPPGNWAAESIDQRELAYYRERLRNRVFDCVLRALAERSSSRPGVRASIARRLGKDPAQVTRLLSGPSNLTLDTLSDLLLALAADLELDYRLAEQPTGTNYEHPWSNRPARDKPELGSGDLRARTPLTSSSSNLASFKLATVETG